MRPLHDVLDCVNHIEDAEMLASIRVECDRVLRAARSAVSDRLKGIVVEFELLNMHDVEDRAYFRDFLMVPTATSSTSIGARDYDDDDDHLVQTSDAINAACAWMLRDNMGVETETILEIFAVDS